MVFTPFPSAGKQLEKILSLYHARGYEKPLIFDFKQLVCKIGFLFVNFAHFCTLVCKKGFILIFNVI